jgi:hypothetical protein
MADNNRTQRIYRYETRDPPLPRQHRRSRDHNPVPVIYRRTWSSLSVQRAMPRWLAQKYSNGGRRGSRVESGRSVVRISGGCCRLVTRKIENYDGVTLGVFSLHPEWLHRRQHGILHDGGPRPSTPCPGGCGVVGRQSGVCS